MRSGGFVVGLVVVAALAGACGKKAGAGSGAATGSASGSASSAPPPAPPDAGPPPAAQRAKDTLAIAASVIDDLTAAIGKDRCGSADRVHKALAADADKLAKVAEAFKDPQVLVEVGKLPGDQGPIATAMDNYSKTMIDGDCGVTEDKDAVQAMLAPAVKAMDDAAAASLAATPPIPPPPGDTSIPECDLLRGVARRLDACKSVPAEVKKSLQDSVLNNLGATEGTMPDNYKEYVRPRCKGTTDLLIEQMLHYGCT
jgi:hypothetical protein